MMRQLRTIHLYLGCFFGPMLMFFAISGIWQTLKLHLPPNGSASLAVISTIHTSRSLKAAGINTLSSPLLETLVIAMALGLLVTAIIGIVMAFRFGRSRGSVLAALVVGALFPVSLILIRWLS
jgi:hypothetical protein